MDWTIEKIVLLSIYGSATLATILLMLFNCYRTSKFIKETLSVEQKVPQTGDQTNSNHQPQPQNSQEQPQPLENDFRQSNQNNIGENQKNLNQAESSSKRPILIPGAADFCKLTESLNEKNSQNYGYLKFHNQILNITEPKNNIFKNMLEKQLQTIESNLSQNNGVNSWIFYAVIRNEYVWVNARMKEKEIVMSTQKPETLNQITIHIINKIQFIKNFNLNSQILELNSDNLEEQMKELNEKCIAYQNKLIQRNNS